MTKHLRSAGFLLCVMLAGTILMGCANISKANVRGEFEEVYAPSKDFTSLGLVFTENEIKNNKGKVFTYVELLKEAQKLGADDIINVVVDVQYEGTRLGLLWLSRSEIWYGSALAIKYTDTLYEEKVESVIANGSVASTSTAKNAVIRKTDTGSGLFGGGGDSGGKGGFFSKLFSKK
jgi:hypothetical protein